MEMMMYMHLILGCTRIPAALLLKAVSLVKF